MALREIRRRIALIAHDSKKRDLAQWVYNHQSKLRKHKLISTATTGSVIQKSCPSLELCLTKSGPMGGDQQIGAMIATEEVGLLVFFTDPLSPHPHDVDVKALTRLAIVYDIPMACSLSTADLIAASGFLDQ
tara:strand:+ start:90 stop:485 length:396 start_codon:yes stop_codon:yes gene_type:complete